MDKIQREHWAFLMRQHEAACFEVGQHHEEYSTPYSSGAEAIERLAAINSKEGSDGNS
jgi:hypothetical protein